MGRLRLECAVVALCLLEVVGCGGSKPAGIPSNPAKVILSPGASVSAQLGSTITFIGTAQNASGTTIGATIIFQSSDTSILDIAPGGVACAGKWNGPAFTVCTPAGVGMVQVTASADGAVSAPTFVFVHPHIDNIAVEQVFTTSPPPLPQPCVSSGQSITLQARALSQGTDISASVGPFTWSAVNANVVKLTPIINTTNNFATNQATALASSPGLTQVFATANGVSSAAFVQPADDSPHAVPLDFFETCPVQSIVLEVGSAGSQRTSFALTKGTSQTITATVTDILGNILTDAPLTWSSSEPTAVSAAVACGGHTCSVSTPGPGSGTVTASCTPPTCNIGFPLVPPGLAFSDMQQFVPVPVYADTAISGVVTGASTATNVLASSLGCRDTSDCTAVLYNISTTTNQAGNPIGIPKAPNSLLLDPTGTKGFAGSTFGAQSITVASLGGGTNAFTTLGTVTGKLLTVSPNGNLAIFSDTVHTPNQVFVVNATTPTSPGVTPLNISGATVAAFSPDGLKAFILGTTVDTNTNNKTIKLYVYSALQSLQTFTVVSDPNANADTIVFSSNGAFAYIAGEFPSPSLKVYSVCNNQLGATISLPSASHLVKTIPAEHVEGLDSNGAPFSDGLHLLAMDASGISVVTGSNPGSCTQAVTYSVQRIELRQGTIDPLNFFVSPDATKAYILARDRSLIPVYDFNIGSVSSSIPLANNAATGESVEPVAADMSVDRTLLYVAGDDGTLHAINMTSAVDLLQISFPDLSNRDNAFCTVDPTTPCVLDFVAVKP